MMKPSLIQMASAFHNKILQNAISPEILTVLPATRDIKLPHPGCSQHEPRPLLQPTSGVRLGSLQPTQNPGG